MKPRKEINSLGIMKTLDMQKKLKVASAVEVADDGRTPRKMGKVRRAVDDSDDN